MRTLYLVWGLMVFLVSSVWAETAAVGSVQTVRGEAYVTTAGKQVRAAVGTVVFTGSQLSTGAQSSLGVVFNDSTVMSFGANTSLTVDAFIYAPSTGQHAFATKLAKGSMGYLSGAIAKLKPQSVSIQTNTGTLGIRGTRLLAIDAGPQSFVTLLADPDGRVGQVQVQGVNGQQLLTVANTSAPLDGSRTPTPTDSSAIQQQFGDVLNAFPPQPPLPLQGGAGAQPSIAAAAGGTSGGLLTLGVLAATVVVEGMKGSTGTSGTTGTR